MQPKAIKFTVSEKEGLLEVKMESDGLSAVLPFSSRQMMLDYLRYMVKVHREVGYEIEVIGLDQGTISN
jgi:hypothetical protein